MVNPDAVRGQVLLEESREAVVVLDEDGVVLAASRRARQSLGVCEGDELSPELLPGERLDYAWIEDARGERVWETTRANTDPAGGSPKNRVFDGILTLDPGRYTAHAVTNGRHAAGDFEGGAPDEPDAWGLRIDRLGDEEVEL